MWQVLFILVFAEGDTGSARGVAELTLSTADGGTGYGVEVWQGLGVVRCQAPVQARRPCRLRIAFGAAEVRVEGSASGRQAIFIPPGRSELQIARRSDAHARSMTGASLIAVSLGIAFPLVVLGLATDTKAVWISGVALGGIGVGFGVAMLASRPRDSVFIGEPEPVRSVLSRAAGATLSLAF